ncbi:hypothetical protein C8F04DRAFT_1075208 [Mycena alexandri]|uniref:F-box domain-containing protein n=1 Tax=Mycena alexandri TaxID=1745969 RepID=A0AAD6X8D0_9AGAR|nr:hypothetical protein C8F04DRAFT_1075208 [Mycena alexandri]
MPNRSVRFDFAEEQIPPLLDQPIDERPGLQSDTQPLPTLPPELLAEIFINFLPAYPNFPPYFGFLSPLMLCRICRQWRAIALSTPALWTAMRFAITSFDSRQSQKLELLKTWLGRSGDCPLRLSFKFWGGGNPGYLPQFLQTIVAHCARWEDITLLVPLHYMHHIQGEMPLLRHLKFGPHSPLTRRDHEKASGLTLFDRVTQLRTLVLTDGFTKARVRHLPWAQLTHIESHIFDEFECVELIRDATQLTHCKLGVCPPNRRDTHADALGAAAIVQRPRLRHLILLAEVSDDSDAEDFDDESTWAILDRLSLPALRALQVPVPHITLDSLKNLILRSQCTLQELDVLATTLPESVFREALPPFGAFTKGYGIMKFALDVDVQRGVSSGLVYGIKSID